MQPARMHAKKLALTNLCMEIQVTRLPSSKSVNIAVIHAESRGDRNCVMNLKISGSGPARTLHVIQCDLLPVFFYSTGNGKQSL
jgi:hypothetical protein